MTRDSLHELETLARMANQIAAFFRAYPEDVARHGVQDHIEQFWTPVMRAELLAHADTVTLDPLVRAVLPALH